MSNAIPEPDHAPSAAALQPLPPGRHGLPREKVQASQRSRLLFAIIDVVGSRGYAATRIADVIRTASVSKDTFYVHFADKETCFLAAYDGFARYLCDEIKARFAAAEGSWHARYASSTHCYLEILMAYPARTRALLLEVLAAGPAVLARRRVIMQIFEDNLRSVHAAARREDPLIPAASQALYAFAIGGIDEQVRAAIARDDFDALPALLPDIVDFVRRCFDDPMRCSP